VHAEERAREGDLGGEVAVGDGVEAVVRGLVEPQGG